MSECPKHKIPLRNRKDKKGKYCPICMQWTTHEMKDMKTGRHKFLRSGHRIWTKEGTGGQKVRCSKKAKRRGKM